VIFSRQFSYEFSILLILSVVGILFFPAACGSYSAVHGPVTALRSATAKINAWLPLTLASMHICECLRFPNLTDLGAHRVEVLLPRPSIPKGGPVLRC
jgi:hypothetical protein